MLRPRRGEHPVHSRPQVWSPPLVVFQRRQRARTLKGLKGSIARCVTALDRQAYKSAWLAAGEEYLKVYSGFVRGWRLQRFDVKDDFSSKKKLQRTQHSNRPFSLIEIPLNVLIKSLSWKQPPATKTHQMENFTHLFFSQGTSASAIIVKYQHTLTWLMFSWTPNDKLSAWWE